MPSFRVAGIDLGIGEKSNLGVGYHSADCKYGFGIPGSAPWSHAKNYDPRYVTMTDELMAFFHRHRPHVVVVEHPSASRFMISLEMFVLMGAVIRCAWEASKSPCIVLHTSSIRKMFCGRGDAKKEAVVGLAHKFGLDGDSDDVVEARIHAWVGYHALTGGIPDGNNDYVNLIKQLVEEE